MGIGTTSNQGDSAGEMGDSLTTVDLSYNALSVDAGMDHVCAVVDTSSGRVQCWGGNQQVNWAMVTPRTGVTTQRDGVCPPEREPGE